MFFLSGGHEADGARGVRTPLPAPGRPGAGGRGDHPPARRAGGAHACLRPQADAAAPARRPGEERPRPQGWISARPAVGADHPRGRARFARRQPLHHRVLRAAQGHRANLRAPRRLLHPRGLDGHRPGRAARVEQDAPERSAAQRAGDGRLDRIATRRLSLEDTVVSAPETLEDLTSRQYKYGFVTDIEADAVPRGLNEDIIRLISAKKNEPAFMLEWRLRAFRHWLTMKEPRW